MKAGRSITGRESRRGLGAWSLSLAGVLLFGSFTAIAEESDLETLKRRVAELEKKLSAQEVKIEEKTTALATEVEKNRISSFLPEKAELKSEWGMGPAASGVYHVKQGVSLGGYLEMNYRALVDDKENRRNQTDLYRLVTYLGYKFTDSIILNTEVEFEHGTTDDIGGESGEESGKVSVEFAYLDFLFDPKLNARVGMVLIPIGFISEIHEPPYYHGALRPEVERVIVPSTWRENGVGVFGEFDLAGKLEYRTYLVSGLRASRFSDSGIREGRQSGNRAIVEDVAWTGRVDYSPRAISGALLGGSFWIGDSGQDDVFVGEQPSVATRILSAHAEYRYRQFELRALGAWTTIDDTALLNAELGKSIGEEQYGWYLEGAYDLLPLLVEGTTQYLAPYVRYEDIDTQADLAEGYFSDGSMRRKLYSTGLTYKPVEKVSLKLEYRNFETDGSKKIADEVIFGAGVAF